MTGQPAGYPTISCQLLTSKSRVSGTEESCKEQEAQWRAPGAVSSLIKEGAYGELASLPSSETAVWGHQPFHPTKVREGEISRARGTSKDAKSSRLAPEHGRLTSGLVSTPATHAAPGGRLFPAS